MGKPFYYNKNKAKELKAKQDKINCFKLKADMLHLLGINPNDGWQDAQLSNMPDPSKIDRNTNNIIGRD